MCRRQGSNVAGGDCTTRLKNAHRTLLREVLYRHHPWFGRRVCVHGRVEKADDVAFRCSLDGSQTDGCLEVPAWTFDRTACPDAEPLTVQPFVSIDALAALSALLDLALKDRTPSAALLSFVSRTSHDQKRGETHVTADGNARERVPTRSTTAPATADGSVRERPGPSSCASLRRSWGHSAPRTGPSYGPPERSPNQPASLDQRQFPAHISPSVVFVSKLIAITGIRDHHRLEYLIAIPGIRKLGSKAAFLSGIKRGRLSVASCRLQC
ncbi:hypothetical protein GGD62_008298 [Bradyrhizobium sp. ERR14]|nr:hypothetical protein [Bradyrhizobium sp. ERR14]